MIPALLVVAGLVVALVGLFHYRDHPAAALPVTTADSDIAPLSAASAPVPVPFAVSSPSPEPAWDVVVGPHRLVIPALAIDAPLVAAPIADDGALVVPDNPAIVGLSTLAAPLDAGSGTSLVAGHVNMNRTPGALWRLAQIRPGTRVITTSDRGERREWIVDELTVHPKDALPEGLTAAEGRRRLAVVTCGGSVRGGEYEKNVIAWAQPSSSQTDG